MNSTIHQETDMTIALRQTKDKLFHHASVFISLIIFQVIGYLISFQAASGGVEAEYFHFYLRSLNPFVVYFFTVLWIVIQGWSFAGKISQQEYPGSNNFTTYFSDIAVLEIYSLVGGFTILLSVPFLQVLAGIISPSPIMHPPHLFISAFFYLLIGGAGAYTVGIFRTRYGSRFFLGVLIITLWIGVSVVAAQMWGFDSPFNLAMVAGFYLDEARFIVWLIKVVATVAALYGISWLGIRSFTATSKGTCQTENLSG